MLARFYRGGFDLWELTPQQWRGLVSRIGDLLEMETGEIDHAARVRRLDWRKDTGE